MIDFPSALLWFLILAAFGVAGIASALVLRFRARCYVALIGYDPRQDLVPDCLADRVEVIAVRCTSEFVRIPPMAHSASAAYIELDFRSTMLGQHLDPCLALAAGDGSLRMPIERGTRGRRLIPLTALLPQLLSSDGRIALHGRHLAWSSGWVRLHLVREAIAREDAILVVAPHPDDAEIAAYGLYEAFADQAHVLTITTGDATTKPYSTNLGREPLPRADVAQVRVADSLAAPLIAGIPSSRIGNQCYPDGELAALRRAGEQGRPEDRAPERLPGRLRALNPDWIPRQAVKSWTSLVDDLVLVIERLKPDVIVAPCPWIETHPDHVATAQAVCEALLRAKRRDGQLLFYIVHPYFSEAHPLGPAGGPAPVPNMAGRTLPMPDAVFCQSLTPAQMARKYCALEGMRDLRAIAGEARPLAKAWLDLLRRTIRQLILGRSHPDTDLLRRSIRSEEFFLVYSCTRAVALVLGDRVAGESGSRNGIPLDPETSKAAVAA